MDEKGTQLQDQEKKTDDKQQKNDEEKQTKDTEKKIDEKTTQIQDQESKTDDKQEKNDEEKQKKDTEKKIDEKTTQIQDQENKNDDKKQENKVDQEMNEEEEEEQRRRDELDIDDEYFFSTAVIKPPPTTTTTMSNSFNEQIPSTNDDGEGEWQVVKKKPYDRRRLIRQILQHPTTLTDQTVNQITNDLWQLSAAHRHDLYRYWLTKYQHYLHNSVRNARRDYNQAASALAEYHQEEDYHILKDSIIVAMTTTCAAKYHTVLEKLRKRKIFFKSRKKFLINI
jgi:hypothetical protein